MPLEYLYKMYQSFFLFFWEKMDMGRCVIPALACVGGARMSWHVLIRVHNPTFLSSLGPLAGIFCPSLSFHVMFAYIHTTSQSIQTILKISSWRPTSCCSFAFCDTHARRETLQDNGTTGTSAAVATPAICHHLWHRGDGIDVGHAAFADWRIQRDS